MVFSGAAFRWTLPISLLWIVLWMLNYKRPEQHNRVCEEELAYINNDSEKNEKGERLPWKVILPHRGTWAIAIAKCMTDPIWWFYLFLGAKFLNEKFGVNLKEIGMPFFTIYLSSWCMGMLSGGFSSRLLKKGLGINRGIKLGMLACGLCAVPVQFVPHTNSLWLAVALISMAAGGHCGWSTNVFSLMSDVFPKKTTASIAGFGGFSGAAEGHGGLWSWQDFTVHWHRWIYHFLPGGWSGLSVSPGDHPPDCAQNRTLKTIGQE